MVFTKDEYLPSYDELKVQELNISSAPLKAGAVYFGKYCDNVSSEYMLCMQEEGDVRKCLPEGKAVTGCAVEFYSKVKSSCADSFTNYWKCVESNDVDTRWCKSTRALFSQCVQEKIGVEEPPLGYFNRTRELITARARPEEPVIPGLPRPVDNYDETNVDPKILEKAKWYQKFSKSPIGV